MTVYDRDSTLSLGSAPEHLPESDRGAQQETDVSASVLQQMSRASDLQEGLMERYRQGGRGYAQAMFALQRVLGNVGVERLHQQITELAEAEEHRHEVEVQRLELEADAARQNVQMKRGEDAETPSNAKVLDAAADGASASGEAVPFAEEMETLLGVDFAETRAHLGPEATAACEEMGAEAYTYGENVVFRDANPRKETVAHELTHVMQQRQGVPLTGGVGQVGDAYEREAEQAERGVVAGPSTEPATSRTLAVQAKEEAEPTGPENGVLEDSTEPLDCPQFLASPEDWVKLQAAFDSGPDDGLQALVSLTPILQENAKASITFSAASLEGKEAETTFGPEAKAWLLEEFATFQQQHHGLASEQLVSQYVSHVKQLGIPESLQTVEVFVNIDRLGTSDEKELAYTISTIHHEMTHAHQLLHEYLRVFPAGVSLDVNWLGSAYPLEEYVVQNETEEISAMELGAYSEQAKALDALGIPPRGDYSDALGTLNLLHEHWTNASPKFRESADADGKFVQAYMVHLEHFLEGFLEAVRPISVALLGGFDAASLSARRLGQGRWGDRHVSDRGWHGPNDVRRSLCSAEVIDPSDFVGFEQGSASAARTASTAAVGTTTATTRSRCRPCRTKRARASLKETTARLAMTRRPPSRFGPPHLDMPTSPRGRLGLPPRQAPARRKLGQAPLARKSSSTRATSERCFGGLETLFLGAAHPSKPPNGLG